MIIVDRPPNFEAIRAAFPSAESEGVIFAYDGDIYNPSGGEIPPMLIAHENVHLARQKALDPHDKSTSRWSGADLWWLQYIENSEFRYHEELLAHAAEFKAHRRSTDRNAGAALLMRTALRLTAPLYNYQPPRTVPEALKDLRHEVQNV